MPLRLVSDNLIGVSSREGQRGLKRAVRNSAYSAVSTGVEIDVVDSAAGCEVDPELRRPVGEFDAVDVITAGSHASEEDRLHPSERADYGVCGLIRS